MKLAVVGANGFLGQQIVRECARNGHQVTAIVRRSGVLVTYARQTGRLRDLKQLGTLDGVVLAAGNFRQSAEELAASNQELVHSVMRSCPQSRIVFVSSTAVYGSRQHTCTELTPSEPEDAYGNAKLAAERTLAEHASYAVVRLTALYGPGMDRRLFIPAIIRSAEETRQICLVGDGSRSQNYLHVTDAATLVVTAMSHRTNVTVLGADVRSYSNREVAEIVAGLYPGTVISTSGKDTSPSFAFDCRRTRQILGWAPRISLSDGLSEMADRKDQK